jgi:hypothetical protein
MRACHSASAAPGPSRARRSRPSSRRLLEADHLFVVQLAQALHVPDHDAAQGGRRSRTSSALSSCSSSSTKISTEFESLHQVFDLARRVGRVDAGADAAAGEHREVGEQPFLARVAEDRGGLADLEAEFDQAHAGLAHDGADLVPRQALPQAELLLPEQRQLAALGHGVPEHLGQVVVPGTTMLAFECPRPSRSCRQAPHGLISMCFFFFHRRPSRTPAP